MTRTTSAIAAAAVLAFAGTPALADGHEEAASSENQTVMPEAADGTTLFEQFGFSEAVIHGDTVYLAGQVAEDPEADIQEQTRSTLARVDAALAEAGTDREHLLSTTIYLRDIDNHFALMNEVWNAWMPSGHAPARACVEAHMARSGLLVEICVVAALP